MTDRPIETLHHLQRPEGRIAYDDHGHGPLVVCVPGVGDTRAEYRELGPRLVAAGYRVVTLDLRGHGASDTTFSEWDRPAAGGDVVALLEQLDAGPAHLIGCSLGASAVAWAAAEAPGHVASVTLIGPFVRDGAATVASRLQRGLLGAALRGSWGPAVWAWWHGRIHGAVRPHDLAEHRAALRTMLREPGRLAAMRRLALSACADVEARLGEVRAPSLVVMGTADPDWPDPVGEAEWIAQRLGGQVLLVDGAGHYPHVERPEVVADGLTGILRADAARMA